MSKYHKKNKNPINKEVTKEVLGKTKKQVGGYAKYSSIAIQMGLIITGGSLGGLKLDQYLENEFPFFVLSFSVLSVVLAVYLAIKDIIKYNS